MLRPAVTALALALAPASHADLQAPRQRADQAPPPAPDEPQADTSSPLPNRIEAPRALKAADLLGPEMMTGPFHRVRSVAPTDGYMAHITIDTDFGTYQCVGVDQARQRIAETGAISRLVAESKSDLFAEALKKSIEQPVEAVKNIVKNPVGTVAQAPKTVGHFFRRVGSSIKSGAERIADKAERAAQRDESDESAAALPPRASTGENIAATGRGLIGFDKAKLECARQLGVDPYSDNPILQEHLEKVSWVYFAGGLPVRIGAMAASGGTSIALASTKMIGLPEEVYALTPAELAQQNRKTLETLDAPGESKTSFMENAVLTPTLKRSILRSVERLAPASGRIDLIDLAARCETIEQAQFLDRSLRLLSSRQNLGLAQYTSVVTLGRVPAGVTASGGLEVAAVVDFISWTEEVADFARRDDLRSRKPTLLLTGEASESAIVGFEEAGWKFARP